MKITLPVLCLAALLFSCDPNEGSRVRNPNLFQASHASDNGGSGAFGASATDVPFDGGLGALLLTGAAIGMKRMRQQRPKTKK